MKNASIYALDFELTTDQANQINGLPTRHMIFKIAGWMAEKGLRVTQTEVGRLIYRYTGQTPSKTTLKEAVDSFYSQALQTATNRKAVGEIPSPVMDSLESIYLHVREAIQLQFQSERKEFDETIGLLKQRIDQVESDRAGLLLQISQKEDVIESLSIDLSKAKTESLSLTDKLKAAQEASSGFWSDLLKERNAHQATKLEHSVEIRQISAALHHEINTAQTTHQSELNSLRNDHACEIKRITSGNHEHTTKLLLQIDELRTESTLNLSKKDQAIESISKQLERTQTDKAQAELQIRRLETELSQAAMKNVDLQRAVEKIGALEKQLSEANLIISSLSTALRKTTTKQENQTSKRKPATKNPDQKKPA